MTPLFRPEEYGGAKDALEALNDPLVVVSVLREFEVVKHLSRTGKTHHATLLENGEGSNPNGDEAVLTKRQSVLRMGDDFEGEIPVAPGVSELICGRSPERNSTKDEWARMVGEFLFAVFAFLAHKADGIELFDFTLRQTDATEVRTEAS